MKPRRYQEKAVESARNSWRAGKRSICLVGPTGMGKTYLATLLAGPAIDRGKRVAFFVHREELQEQAKKAFERIGIRAGIVRADSPPTSRQLQIVSIQTAARRDLQFHFDLAFLDECHHFVSDQWSKPIERIKAAGTGILGLTATPDRGDGRGLAPLFDDLIIVAQPRELIASGHLVPCRVIGPTRARKSLAEHPVAAYQQWAKGRRTIVFAGTVDYARKLAVEFDAAGFRAACVDGKMTDWDRAQAIERFRHGELDVLTSVAVLTEGFDVPETSCVITTTGASSPGPLIQKVGRGMRPAPGKTNCIHLDLRAAWRELAMLPDEDRQFNLSGRAITGAAREYGDAIVQCRGCGCWFRANEFINSTCPECHLVRKGKEDPRIRRARLAVMSARMPQEERVSWLARKIVEGRTKRRKDGTPYKAVGWALQQYCVRFRNGGQPERPTRESIDAAMRMAEGER